MKNFIVVTGGVISGLGKGITASTIGLLFKKRGIDVTAVKIDPYLNVDAGTMSPYEHGECYVLNDGGEADLDLGNYERFLNTDLNKNCNITSGKVYKNVIDRERSGDYLGRTVQIVPHITDEIKRLLLNCATRDICVIELGGTVGDIEGMSFIEAIKQLSMDHNVCFVHVSLLLAHGKEFKTKPTQSSIRDLNNRGIFPNLLCLRTDTPTPESIKNKLQSLCRIHKSNIIDNVNIDNIYQVPALFDEQNVCDKIASILKINLNERPMGYLSTYHDMSNLLVNKNDKKRSNIFIIGKYTENDDTYLSIIRAIEHASLLCNVVPNIIIKSSHKLSDNIDILSKADAVIIPGGFGLRGTAEKINAITYCRENKIPILGICLGFQMMAIELARNVCGVTDAKSEEDNSKSGTNVIIMNPECVDAKLGGSMRLGLLETLITQKCMTQDLYGMNIIMERHRHRYEFNKGLSSLFKSNKIILIGDIHIDILEFNDHPFFIGCQYHPEYISRLERPHPLFIGLIKKTIQC